MIYISRILIFGTFYIDAEALGVGILWKKNIADSNRSWFLMVIMRRKLDDIVIHIGE